MNSSESVKSSIPNFTHIHKKKIAERISAIKTKKHIKDIFKIVHEHSALYTKSSSGNGVFLNINNYDDDTLTDIEKFLNEEYPIVDSIPIATKFKTFLTDSASAQDSTLKLTNREKNVLRKINNNSDNDKNSLMESETITTRNKITVKPLII